MRAEMIALPITLLLLVLVFGSVVAALLPLAIGILAIVGTFARAAGDRRRSPRCRSSPSTSPPPWASASPSTTACSSSPGSARSWPPGFDPNAAVVAHRAHRRPHGGLQRRSPSPSSLCGAARVPARVPAVVRLRRRRRGRSSPGSARSSCCPRCWPCSAGASTRCAIFGTGRRRPWPGHLAPDRARS